MHLKGKIKIKKIHKVIIIINKYSIINLRKNRFTENFIDCVVGGGPR